MIRLYADFAKLERTDKSSRALMQPICEDKNLHDMLT